MEKKNEINIIRSPFNFNDGLPICVFDSDQKVGTIVRTPNIDHLWIDVNGNQLDNEKILLYKSFFSSFRDDTKNDGVPFKDPQIGKFANFISKHHDLARILLRKANESLYDDDKKLHGEADARFKW